MFLNPTEVEDLKAHTSRAQEITTQKSRTAQKEKFDRLLKKNAPPNSRWVVNLSKKKLNPNEEAVLRKGMNFAVTPGRIPVEDIITGVEGGLQGLTGSEVDKARLKIAGVLTSAKPPPSNLPWSLRKALSDLKKEEDIVILPADKGRSTVVMDKSEYQDKVDSLLGDRKFYKVLKKDPTPSTERDMNASLLKMKKEGTIPEPLYHRLRSSGGHIPLLYGLPKIHKPGVPLRPIVSFVSSPTYALSKYLARVLSPLVGNSKSFVASSSEFVTFSKEVTIPDNYELVSFDVVSLFTNVPIDLALSVVEKRLDEMDVSDRTPLSKEALVSLLRLCLSSTNFYYNGTVYQQIFGTAMGSPVSVVVANIVMEHIEDTALNMSPVPTIFWKRYVDDVLTAIPADRVDEMLAHINSINHNIQFTLEREKEHVISFLDVKLMHNEDGSLSTKVYRKPTHTDQYLQFSSHHPTAHTRAVVSTFCLLYTSPSPRD